MSSSSGSKASRKGCAPGVKLCAVDAAAVAAPAGREQQLRVATGPGILPSRRPGLHVGRARSVTRLAADTHLRPVRVVRVGRRLVALVVPRGVTEEALRVRGHAAIRPVPPVGRRARLAGEEIEPVAALHVERQRQRLQASGRERADVLLDVAMAERIGERHVRVVIEAPAEHRELAVAYDHRAIVVRVRTEPRLRRRGQHREMVIGLRPRTVLALVTVAAACGADVRASLRSAPSCGIPAPSPERRARAREAARVVRARRSAYQHLRATEKWLTPGAPPP